MVCGFWRSLIVMPPSAAHWSPDRFRVVVLHELAHVKRRDCLTQILTQMVCAIYWFNPLIWIAARKLREERERACDDFVLAAGTKGSDYAGHLLEIARTMRPRLTSPLAGAGLAMAHRSQLEGRLLAILDPAIRRSPAFYGRTAAIGAILVVSIPVAAVQRREMLPALPDIVLREAPAQGPIAVGSTPDDRRALARERVAVATPIAQAAAAAPQAAPLRFDVASIRISPDPRSIPVVRPDSGTPRPGGTWTASFATLDQLIRTLYPGHGFAGQIVGSPSWLSGDRFEIIAKTEPERSNEEMRAMARALLADRFQLSMHAEMRELPAYVLVRARSDGTLGPGLRAPEVDCDAYRAAQEKHEPLPPTPVRYGDRLPCVATIMSGHESSGGLRLTAGGTRISGILALLANQVGRPVVDGTGLSQPFDIELPYSALRPLTVEAPPPAPDAGLLPIREAIQSQLGLKLEEGTAPVEVLVIDRVERPSEN
jgi:uncharacterized protein (TIGR03435 family)